jgi:hypothetical protein
VITPRADTRRISGMGLEAAPGACRGVTARVKPTATADTNGTRATSRATSATGGEPRRLQARLAPRRLLGQLRQRGGEPRQRRPRGRPRQLGGEPWRLRAGPKATSRTTPATRRRAAAAASPIGTRETSKAKPAKADSVDARTLRATPTRVKSGRAPCRISGPQTPGTSQPAEGRPAAFRATRGGRTPKRSWARRWARVGSPGLPPPPPKPRLSRASQRGGPHRGQEPGAGTRRGRRRGRQAQVGVGGFGGAAPGPSGGRGGGADGKSVAWTIPWREV